MVVCRRPNDFLGAAGELSIEKQKKHHPFLFLVLHAAFIKMKVVVFFSLLQMLYCIVSTSYCSFFFLHRSISTSKSNYFVRAVFVWWGYICLQRHKHDKY